MVRTLDRSLCTHASPVRCHQCFPGRPPEHFMMRKMWFMRHLAAVDAFACPSLFMIEHFVRWGIPREKIHQVPNGQRRYGVPMPAPEGLKTRFGFFGQFVDNKGVHILLRAVRQLRAEGFTDFSVDLNGDNIRFATPPFRKEIETFLAEEGKLPPDEQIVTLNGSYHVDELSGRMAMVDWCIVPSTWWGNLRAGGSRRPGCFGKPVICSNVGGPGERVTDEVDGLHFQVNDHRALARTIRRAASEPGLWERLRAKLPPPPARSAMVDAYRALYDGTACSNAASGSAKLESR